MKRQRPEFIFKNFKEKMNDNGSLWDRRKICKSLAPQAIVVNRINSLLVLVTSEDLFTIRKI